MIDTLEAPVVLPKPSLETAWEKPVQKNIYTLNIGRYAPEITDITYPLIAAWARKIGAGFKFITERKFPEWPITYEKLQLFEISKRDGNDWTIYVDSDTLIHPDFFDPTVLMSKDTVAHNGKDPACIRWRYDAYFKRDGRHIGNCNWMCVASDLCRDIWRPLDDLTMEQAVANIFPTVGEHNCQIVPAAHLIDDYTLSRNVARFGLKYVTMIELCQKFGMQGNPYLFHLYAMENAQKAEKMKATLKTWGVS
jgi:hypothetical protein